jgi:hypothetical protein
VARFSKNCLLRTAQQTQPRLIGAPPPGSARECQQICVFGALVDELGDVPTLRHDCPSGDAGIVESATDHDCRKTTTTHHRVGERVCEGDLIAVQLVLGVAAPCAVDDDLVPRGALIMQDLRCRDVGSFG